MENQPYVPNWLQWGHFFYEKVRKVKADVAALLIFDLRHISTKKFALGSLRSDDWQLGRPTVPPLFVRLAVKPWLFSSVLHRASW
jgi:hypothetical protein